MGEGDRVSGGRGPLDVKVHKVQRGWWAPFKIIEGASINKTFTPALAGEGKATGAG
jgi:hypothetical protein